MDQIVLNHVTKQFTTKTLGTVTAVNDFNLTIKEGECFSFLGPSGCGKTTTLRMIAGFEDLSDGEIHLCGRPVDKSLPPGLPGSPEVDEIIPVSKGGSPYLFSNCRLAHRWCNRVRSNHSVAWAREHIKQTFEQGHTADLKATSMPLVTSGDW